MTQLTSLVLFTADPWESAMPVLRIVGPAKASNVAVLCGNEGGQVFPDRIAQADLVIIQRDFPHLAGYGEIIAKARAENKPVVYEIDDLLFELPENHISFQNYIVSLLPMVQAAMQADAVVTSSHLLKEYFSEFNSNTWYSPNLIDDTLWPMQPVIKPSSKGGPVVISYMGGQTHLPDLEMVAPALIRVNEKYGNHVQFHFWGGPSPANLANYPQVEQIPFDILNYQQFVAYFSQQTCDIFIAPLRDIFFNRCKTAIKYLEYSSMGIPGVYSQIQPYVEIIEPGVNGFMASTVDEWFLRLCQLIEDSDLRDRVGSQALKTVKDHWLLTKKASHWFDLYNQIINRKYDNKDSSSNFIKAVIRGNQYQGQLEKQIDNLNLRLFEIDSLLQQRDIELNDYKMQMQAILNSRSWRLLMKVGQIRSFFGIKAIRS